MKDAVMSMKKGKNPLLFLMVVLVLGIVFMPVDLSAESEKQEIPSEPDEIPFPYELVETLSAEEVNLWWAEQGYDQPPYQPGTSVMVLCLTEDTVFARVYDGEVSGMYGGWIMDYHALDGVHNGGEASAAFADMPNHTPEEIAVIRKNLLAYCGLDTLAMVKVLEKLRECVKEDI